jgi:glutamate synthase (NADPH/NADH) small chain
MAAAQQLARAGHDVTLFEKNDRVGGLLRYGIPDFKMEKSHIDRRVEQMKAEGVTFRTGVMVGAAKDPLGKGSKVTNLAKETVTPEQLQKEFDAVLLTGGAEQSRDLPVPGRDLDGIHFAMEFCQSLRYTRSLKSGMMLLTGQPLLQNGVPQSMQRAPCTLACSVSRPTTNSL